jgi:hypothetical protein
LKASTKALVDLMAVLFGPYLLYKVHYGISISSVNGDLCGDCLVWRSEVEKFFSMGMEEKAPPEEV